MFEPVPVVTRADVEIAAVESALGNQELIDFQVAIGNVFVQNMPYIRSCKCKFCIAVTNVMEKFPV